MKRRRNYYKHLPIPHMITMHKFRGRKLQLRGEQRYSAEIHRTFGIFIHELTKPTTP